MFALAFALVLVFGFPQQTYQEARANAEQLRQQSIQLNTLAGRIRSEADARKLVDSIAELFRKELPPTWATDAIRERVAQAEFAAVSDPARLIPEERVATVWNEYVREIGAPEETLVTPAEIHWLRDAHFSGGQLMWARGSYTSIWDMPNLYALGPDGKVADGCRALESVRMLWDFDNLFENVRVARERMRKGIFNSDLVKKQLDNPNPPKETWRVGTSAKVMVNPVRKAEQRYIQEHGSPTYYLLLTRLFDELFPK